MRIETIIEAVKDFEKVKKLCTEEKRVSFENRQKLNYIEKNYGVTIEQCEVFSDVLGLLLLEQKLREAMTEVYTDALLQLAEEYDDNHEKAKSVVASCLIDQIE